MLKKYVWDEGHIILNFTDLEIEHDVSYVEKSVKILRRVEKVLTSKITALVKVLWDNHGVAKYT